MEKVFTIELDQQGETVELHLNKKGAEFLRDVLNKFSAVINGKLVCSHTKIIVD